MFTQLETPKRVSNNQIEKIVDEINEEIGKNGISVESYKYSMQKINELIISASQID